MPASAAAYTLSRAPDATPNDGLDGDLDITDDLTIAGGGASSTTVDGNLVSRVFHIPNSLSIQVTLQDFSIVNGRGSPSDIANGFPPEAGGAVAAESGTLTLDRLTLAQNAAGAGVSPFDNLGACGGALYAGGADVVLSDSLLRDNVSGAPGNIATLVDTSGSDGGAVCQSGGNLHINRSLIRDNKTSNAANRIFPGSFPGSPGGDGGGVALLSGNLTIDSSTISGNQTGNGSAGTFDPLLGSSGGPGGAGGGVAIFGGTAVIKNSTIAGNLTGVAGASSASTALPGPSGASGGPGAGIAVAGGDLTLNNATVSSNATGNGAAGGGGTPPGADGPGGAGGGLFRISGTVTVGNSLIGGNTVSNVLAAGSGPDCSGSFVSAGSNLIQDPTDCTGFVNGTGGDRTGIDPLLDAAGLKDNGGPTPTIALQSASPAIDAGDGATCEPTDQRGVARLDGDDDGGAACDIGAFEFEHCGDGVVQSGEECDDGNAAEGDGCRPDCTSEPSATTGGTTGETTGGTGGTAGTSGETSGDGGDTAGETNDGNGSGGCSLIRP